MKKHLRDIAEIRSCATLRGRDATRPDPNGPYRFIRISDLSPGGYLLPGQFITINPSEPVRDEFILKPGDVLFACRGVRMQAAAFTFSEMKNAVAGAQFFLLRNLAPSVLPEYLAWAINSPASQTYFTENTSGSYVPLVTLDILKDLQIPVPPVDTQRRILELHKLGTSEHQLLSKITQLRKRVLEGQLQQVAQAVNPKKSL